MVMDALSPIDIRVKFALAKVFRLSGIPEGDQLHLEAMILVRDNAWACAFNPCRENLCPLMFQDEPALVAEWTEGMAEALQRIDDLRAEMNYERKEAEARKTYLTYLQSVCFPSPVEVLSSLKAGEQVEVAGHVLTNYDKTIWITDPFGVDQAFFASTIEGCASFIEVIKSGRVFGL